jgi:hypothetical protein
MAKNINIDLKNIDLKKIVGVLKNIDLASFKKYASLFPSIGLLLVAVVILVMAMLVGKSVSKKMDDSIRTASKLTSIASTVPSEAQAKVEEEYFQKYQQDVNAVELLAVNASRRELICYTPVIFPKPTDSSGQVYNVFGRQYRMAIEKLMERIRAKDAPSEAEIRNTAGVADVGGGAAPAMGMGMPGMGMPGMMGYPGAAIGTQNAMVDAVCLKRSDEIPVYANPSIFSWYGFWEKFIYQSQDDALQNCWSSQIAYWIYEDVISTTESLNAGSTKVAASPVKRLLGVRFDGPVALTTTEGYAGAPVTSGALAVQVDSPRYVMSSASETSSGTSSGTSPNAGPSPFMAESLTGRACDEQIDVIHFAVSVIVDTASVSAFMKELCSVKTHTYLDNGRTETAIHNQITILQFAIEPVGRNEAAHAYYRYGKAGVVQLNLVCEYIFNRKGYDGFKPEVVVKVLDPQAAAGQQPGGTMSFPPPDQGGGTPR